MKIYLTTYEFEGDQFAGPNIHATDWKEATKIADIHGLTVSGVLTDIHKFDQNIEEELEKVVMEHEFFHDIDTENRTIH